MLIKDLICVALLVLVALWIVSSTKNNKGD